MATSSAIVSVGPPQQDGRFWVGEAHTMDNGEVREFNTLYDHGVDYVQIMKDRGAAITVEVNNGG